MFSKLRPFLFLPSWNSKNKKIKNRKSCEKNSLDLFSCSSYMLSWLEKCYFVVCFLYLYACRRYLDILYGKVFPLKKFIPFSALVLQFCTRESSRFSINFIVIQFTVLFFWCDTAFVQLVCVGTQQTEQFSTTTNLPLMFRNKSEVKIELVW